MKILSQYTQEFSYNWKLAAPVMLGMLGHTFVSFIDNVMVGQLGTAELAAVSLGNSFMFIAMSLGIGFSTAITPLMAEADGKGDVSYGKSIFKNGLLLCTLSGVLVFVLIIALKPLMGYMDQPAEVVQLARPYLDLVALSLIPLMAFQGFKQFSDGLSMTRYPMLATLVANVLNVAINYLLIFGKFGFPQLGVVGAAFGTLISRVAMLILLWILLNKSEKSKVFFMNIKIFIVEGKAIKKLISLGAPSAMQMFFEVAVFTAAIWLSGALGKNPQAANQIALNLASMTFMIAMGLSVASMIRVGNQKGLGNFIELRRIAHSIFLMGAILAAIFCLLFLFFNKFLPTLYLDMDDFSNWNDNREVFILASRLLILAGIFQLSDSLQVIILGSLRGLQDVKIPTLITFISYWIIGFPISWFLGKQESLGSFGIWLGLLAGLSSAALLLYLRFNFLSRKLIST